MKKRALWVAAVFSIAVACAKSPAGRDQLVFIPDGQMSQMGAQAFDQMKAQQPSDTDPKMVNYINCIVRPLTEQAKGQTAVEHWDVVVFKDDQANAFALPGGKIGVYTGLLKVAKTD